MTLANENGFISQNQPIAAERTAHPKLQIGRAGAWTATDETTQRKYHTEASQIVPDPELVEAMNLAIDLQTPLLLTGKPGTGKTTAAYWAAWNLHLRQDSVFHIQVRSDSLAQDLRYRFDAVDYFRVAQANPETDPPRDAFLIEGELWLAYKASLERPVVVLFDEIDKAPRDFPNDLLLELDINGFDVPKRDGGPKSVRSQRDNLRLILFTSNRERSLPDAFLRRCLHHEINLTRDQMIKAIRAHVKTDTALLDEVLKHWDTLQGQRLRHQPDLAELILWVRALERGQVKAETLRDKSLRQLPHLSTIIKDPADLERLS